MRTSTTLLFVLVLAALAAACSSGGSNQPPVEDYIAGNTCPFVGGQTCGLTASRRPAVLTCADTGKWAVEDQCPLGCTDETGAPKCMGADPDADLGSDIATDVPTPDATPDVADVAPDGPSTDTIDTAQPDVPELDLPADYTPPTVLSTSPAEDEMNVKTNGLVIRIVFSEPMFTPPFVPPNVKMTNDNLENIPCTLAWEDTEHTILLMTPMVPIFQASPYFVELSTLLGDLAGNRMTETYRFHFFTESPYDMSTYWALAGKYAPTVAMATNSQFPHVDYATRFDFDGNWVSKDNVDNILAATKVDPHVYYSVTETKSHYFIFYIFFFPYRWAESEGARFGNDLAGSMVVVRKSDQMPVAVETYFKVMGQDERSISFLTEDADIIPAGYTYTDFKFDGQLPREDLFPANRYYGWVSSRKHESCLWADLNNGYLEGCQLTPVTQGNMKAVVYKWKGGSSETLNKSPSFPQTAAEVGYSLEHIMDAWWSRRVDIGPDKMFGSAYTYEPFSNTVWPNQPNLANDVASVFVDPVGNDNGRPPWAWRFYPQNGTSMFQIPRGVLFLDPAVHFRVKHDQPFKWKDWDGTSGFSTEYCFNPYFGLDKRGIWPECSAP